MQCLLVANIIMILQYYNCHRSYRPRPIRESRADGLTLAYCSAFGPMTVKWTSSTVGVSGADGLRPRQPFLTGWSVCRRRSTVPPPRGSRLP